MRRRVVGKFGGYLAAVEALGNILPPNVNPTRTKYGWVNEAHPDIAYQIRASKDGSYRLVERRVVGDK